MAVSWKKCVEEFKTFAIRGSVIDMAVGVIIGSAFGKIVNSLVVDIIMPPLGWLLGKVDFTNLFFVLSLRLYPKETYISLAQAQQAGAVTINYGLFLNTVINFLITAVAVFILVKGVNSVKERSLPNEQVERKICPRCCSEVKKIATRCPYCTSDL